MRTVSNNLSMFYILVSIRYCDASVGIKEGSESQNVMIT